MKDAEALSKPFSEDMIFQVEDRPPLAQTLVSAFQHLMAVFVGICTPPMILSSTLGLPPEMSAYLVSIALIASAVGTFFQCNRFGGVGSGLLSVVGTSFLFSSLLTGIAMDLLAGGATPEKTIATISGIGLAGAFVQVIISFMAPLLRKVFTPLVNGIVVAMIGISLCRSGMAYICGGYGAKATGQFGSIENICLGLGVLAVIVALNCSKNNFLRSSGILIGLVLGYAVGIFAGFVDFSPLASMPAVTVPVPFKYGISFSWNGFAVICLGYILITAEAIGDVAACCSITGLPSQGPDFDKRIRGAIQVDSMSSMLATILNGSPLCTFSQNNGIIQMTGIASRHVGKLVALFLLLLGIFPVVGGLFAIMPPPVLGGATLLLFGTVGAAGLRIVAEEKITRRSVLILAVSFGMGMGVEFVPEFRSHMHPILKEFFHSAVSAGGMTAIICNLIFPKASAVTRTSRRRKAEATKQGAGKQTETAH